MGPATNPSYPWKGLHHWILDESRFWHKSGNRSSSLFSGSSMNSLQIHKQKRGSHGGLNCRNPRTQGLRLINCIQEAAQSWVNWKLYFYNFNYYKKRFFKKRFKYKLCIRLEPTDLPVCYICTLHWKWVMVTPRHNVHTSYITLSYI